MTSLHRLASLAAHSLARPPKPLVAALAVALVGFGATAFGLAPLAPDAADLPKRLVTEDIAAEPVAAQLEALAAQPIDLFRSERTRASDTADSLLRRLGIDDAAAAEFMRKDALARRVLEGRGGKMVQARVSVAGMLEALVARYPAERSEQLATHFTRLTIERAGDALT